MKIKEYRIKVKSMGHTITAKELQMVDAGIWIVAVHEKNRDFIPYSNIDMITEIQE